MQLPSGLLCRLLRQPSAGSAEALMPLWIWEAIATPSGEPCAGSIRISVRAYVPFSPVFKSSVVT
nr:hypothetical protein GCM10010200_004850 [Actinomadura rugatobispora]